MLFTVAKSLAIICRAENMCSSPQLSACYLPEEPERLFCFWTNNHRSWFKGAHHHYHVWKLYSLIMLTLPSWIWSDTAAIDILHVFNNILYVATSHRSSTSSPVLTNNLPCFCYLNLFSAQFWTLLGGMLSTVFVFVTQQCQQTAVPCFFEDLFSCVQRHFQKYFCVMDSVSKNREIKFRFQK